MPDAVIDVSTPLFDGRVVHDVELRLAPADWAALRRDYLEDTYYVASFGWGGQVVSGVGVRSRGNGSRSGVKPALKVAFDKYDKKGRFLNQKSITFLNMTQDPPMLRDFLSMQLFRRMGAAAPREAYARVVVNGEYAGLYLLVEEIDTPFLARTFHNSGGWLYDYEWSFPWHFEDLGGDAGAYSPEPFDPQTNKSEPRPESVVKLVRTLNGTAPERFSAEMSPLLDIEKFLRHVAIEVYLAERDGIVGDVGTNNFYLYEPGSGASAFVVIAWDKSETMNETEYPIWRHFDENVLLRKAMEVPELRRRFLELLSDVTAAAGGRGGWLDETARRTYGLMHAAALDDGIKPISNEQFQSSVEDTLCFIAERHIVMERLLLEERR